MLKNSVLWLTLAIVAAAVAPAGRSASLRGSPSSMERQHQVAKEEDFTFLRTPAQVQEFIEEGRLVRIEGNEHYAVAGGVTFPYARAELRTFLERLAAQYRTACGDSLVVTSLTRPISSQPGNAHPLSVHPAGMAADLRISNRTECREWLEGALLSLEQRGLLDATRERNPPHYHVAVFPGPYAAYAARMEAVEAARAARAETPATEPRSTTAAAPREVRAGRGRRGDGLEHFMIAVVLSLALMLAVEMSQGRRRHRWGSHP